MGKTSNGARTRGGSKIPSRRGADFPGAPTYDFAKFSKKLIEIEKILGRRRVPLSILIQVNARNYPFQRSKISQEFSIKDATIKEVNVTETDCQKSVSTTNYIWNKNAFQ